MTDLLTRCALVVARHWAEDDTPEDVAKAVLAEAGVAELVGAARDVLPTLNCMRKQGIRVDPDQVDALESALAKIGATQ